MPRATALRILVLAIVGGVLVDIVVPGNAPGIGVLVLIAALLAAALAAAGRDGRLRMDRADAWFAPAALVFAGCAAVRSEPWLVAADLALAAATATAAILALSGARITRGLAPAIVESSLGAVTAVLAGAPDVLAAVRPARGEGQPRFDGSRVAVGQLAPVARGLVIAVPLVVIFAALFASADAVFASIARTVVDWRPDIDLATMLERAVIVTIAAWGAAGLLALGAGFAPSWLGTDDVSQQWQWPDATEDGRPLPPPSPGTAALWRPEPAPASVSLPRLGTIEATTVLAILDALFALFVVLQVAYLFGGRDTLAASGATYAEYARRGFFELVAAAVVAGLVIVALDVAVERRSSIQLGASIGLLALTAVVLVSAFVRLRLYQDAYGWTELRLVVIVAIGWLAAAIVAAAVLLMRRQTRWLLHALGVVTVVAVLGLNAVGPGGFVAEQNLARAADPSLVPPGGSTGLDEGYLEALGDAAVPASVAALPKLSADDRATVEGVLATRERRLARDAALQGWPAWNLDRQRARDAIAAWRAGTANR
jgi:hypothetical protein